MVYNSKYGAHAVNGAHKPLFSYVMVHKCLWGGSHTQTGVISYPHPLMQGGGIKDWCNNNWQHGWSCINLIAQMNKRILNDIFCWEQCWIGVELCLNKLQCSPKVSWRPKWMPEFFLFGNDNMSWPVYYKGVTQVKTYQTFDKFLTTWFSRSSQACLFHHQRGDGFVDLTIFDKFLGPRILCVVWQCVTKGSHQKFTMLFQPKFFRIAQNPLPPLLS